MLNNKKVYVIIFICYCVLIVNCDNKPKIILIKDKGIFYGLVYSKFNNLIKLDFGKNLNFLNTHIEIKNDSVFFTLDNIKKASFIFPNKPAKLNSESLYFKRFFNQYRIEITYEEEYVQFKG